MSDRGVVLRLTGVRKAFRSPDGESLTVIDVPSFELAQGEQVALRGASGSGKTTLLNLIAGILDADAGSIEVDGADLVKLGEGARDALRARSIGYVFQTFNLLQGYTALENVMLGMMFGRGADTAFATEMLTRVGLAARLHHRPRQLSVGQQQRVAVARALANHPRLVLADEPTGNLDLETGLQVLALLDRLTRQAGKTLIMVTHSREVIGLADRLFKLDEGRLLETAERGAAEGA